jgi:hypothetical protein
VVAIYVIHAWSRRDARSQAAGIARNKNHEGELPFRSTKPMRNPKFWLKALRITAAVLVMVAQVIAACLS